MFELLLFAIALIGSFACGIYDLKTSNVPDSLCLLMIASALLLNSIYGFSTGDFTNLINSLMIGGLFLAFGLLMYFTGQWGGGDGELLVTIGFLVSGMPLSDSIFNSIFSLSPFAMSFFINTFFIGAVYSIVYSLVLIYRNPNIGKDFWNKIYSNKILIMFALLSFPIAFIIVLPPFFFIPLVLILLLLIFLPFSKTIEEGFYKKIPTSKLKVDDMLGEDIPRLRLYKKYIKGLTNEQVKKIKRFKRYVIVREGIRYGIVFPLTLLFTYFFGDFFVFFM